jgi:hypothetical protein
VENGSVRARAAEELAFIHRTARMVVELEDTTAIVEEWKCFSAEAASAKPAGVVDPGVVSLLVELLDESRRLGLRKVSEAVGELSQVLDAIKQSLDQGDDQPDDQELQFKLQEAMDEYQKALALLSNILKKRDCTASAIIQNLK